MLPWPALVLIAVGACAGPDNAVEDVEISDDTAESDVGVEDAEPDVSPDAAADSDDEEVFVDEELVVEFVGVSDGDVVWGRRSIGVSAVSGRPTRVQFFLDDELIRDDDSPPFAAIFDADALATIEHRIAARAENRQGRVVDIEVDVIVDRSPPTIAVLEPGATFDGPIGEELQVEVVADDNDQIAFVDLLFDLEPIGRLVGDERSAVIELQDVAPGEHVMRATAYDRTGFAAAVEVPVFVCGDAVDVPCAGRCRHPDEFEYALGDCGGCGIACDHGEPCVDGVCVCAEPRLACVDGCVDPQRDIRHCGGCGRACDSGQGCLEGTCVDGVPDGFVLIGPGTFEMGSAPDVWGSEPTEFPAHQVTLTRPYLLGETEVTHGQWRRFFEANPSAAWDCGDVCPVEALTWFEAVEYANALSVAEGLRPCYLLGGCEDVPVGLGRSCVSVFIDAPGQDPAGCEGYRLPTEAEWEFAARAGTLGNAAAGAVDSFECRANPELTASAWFDCNSGARPHPVGLLQPNPFGLYDMLGNVFEWTGDYWGDYPSGPQVDPTGERDDIVIRPIRGGAFNERASRIRTASRLSQDPGAGLVIVGFRVARTYQP